ncbi:MAG: ABC transporter substrate-binding protein [Sphingomonadaceae bacterium]
MVDPTSRDPLERVLTRRQVLRGLVVSAAGLAAAACAPASSPAPAAPTKAPAASGSAPTPASAAPTSAPAASSSKPLPDEIKIGYLYPATGAIAPGGIMSYRALQLAMEAKDKVLGKPVKVVVVDNKSDKSEGALGASRLIDQEKVVAILGPLSSSVTIAAAEVAEKAKIPLLSPTATNPLVTQGRKYVFRASFVDPFAAEVSADYAVNKLGAKTCAILVDIQQDYCVGLSQFFRNSFKKATKNENSILSVLSCQTGDKDFRAQLTTIKNLNPDVVYAPNYYTEGALMLRQALELGMIPKIKFLGSDAWNSPEFVDLASPAGCEGALYFTHYHVDAFKSPEAVKFGEEFTKRFGLAPNHDAALGYDAYMLMLDAIERAKSVDGDAICKALEETKDFQAVASKITMTPDHNPIKPVVVNEYRDGKDTFKELYEAKM